MCYEQQRIESAENEIKIAEERLVQLRENLRTLNLEKDELEMKQLLKQMKMSGLDISTALKKLHK